MTKTIKKSLALILSILMLMSVVPMGYSFAADVYVCGEYEYILSGEDATITKYTGSDAVVVIPETLDGHTVTRVGAEKGSDLYPFYTNQTLVSVTIPNSVECIGYGAFYKCPILETVVLGNGVKAIEAGAFRNSANLKSVTIGKELTFVDVNVFLGCNSISTVNYTGSPEEWANISWGTKNEVVKDFENITYFYSHVCTEEDAKYTTAKASDCITDGNYEYWTCSVCEKSYSDSALTIEVTDANALVIKAPGHNFSEEATEAVDATCSSTGMESYKSCTECGKYFAADELDKFAAGSEDNSSFIIGENDNHDFNVDFTVVKTATCTENGLKVKYCARGCEEIAEETVIPALGHNLSYNAAKDPTCNTNGNVEYWYCRRCTKNYASNDPFATKALSSNEKNIPARHTLEKTEADPATCTKDGKIEYWTCTAADCGKFFVYNDKGQLVEKTAAELVDTAKGHTIAKFEGSVGNCYTDSVKSFWYCTVCGLYFKDEGLTEELSKDDIIIKASHKLTFVDEKAKSCTEDGNIKHWHCEACEANFADENGKEKIDVVIPASHNVKYYEHKDPTCTQEGCIRYYQCLDCLVIFADKELTAPTKIEELIIPANGHKLDSKKAKAPTCTEPGNKFYVFCKVCDALFTDKDLATPIEKLEDTVIPASGHTWSADYIDGKDGKHYLYCTVEDCSALKEDSAQEHAWDDGEITTAPTCTETGVKTFKCTVANCTAEKTETVKANGHTASEPVIETPTCIKPGYEGNIVCTVEGCGYIIKLGEYKDRLGHDFTVVLEGHKEPTCTESGKNNLKCSRCSVINTDETEAIGHDFSEWEVNSNPDCLTAGSKTRVCSRFNECKKQETVSIPALGHTFKDEDKVSATPATCVSGGNLAYKKCDTCTLYFAENAKTNSVDGVLESELSIFDTAKDEEAHTEIKEVAKVDATCTSVGYEVGVYCDGCDKILAGHTEIPEINHKNNVHYDRVAPTCSKTGTIEYWACPDCGKNFKDEACTEEATSLEIAVDSTNHVNVTEHNKVDATCLEDGAEAGSYCNDCTTWTGHEIINAKGHTFGTTIPHRSTSCLAPGNNAYKQCSACKLYFVSAAKVDAEDGKETTDSFVLPQLSHSYIGAIKSNGDGQSATHSYMCINGCEKYGPATAHSWDNGKITSVISCTSNGVKTYTCKLGCGAIYTEETQTTGHEFTVKAYKAPTCIATGNNEHKYCSKCDRYFDKNATKYSVDGAIDASYYTLNIDAEGHQGDKLVPDDGTPATCFEAGVTGGTKCTDCGKYISGHATIPAIAHKNKVHYALKPAKCVETGTVEYWACPDCNKNYKNEACTDIATNLVIDALGHTFGDITEYSATSCLASGNYAYKQCSTCNLYFAENAATNATNGVADTSTFVIAQLGHVYTGEIKSDGNGQNATHSFKCINGCDGYGAAVAHTWNSGAVTTVAECLTEGVKTYTCEVPGCGATYTEAVAATGHSFGNITPYVAAECLSAGNEAYKKCEKCNLYFAADAAVTAENGAADDEEFVINALGHDYATTFTVDRKASCTEEGSKSKHCSRCSSKTEITDIPTRTHNYVDTTVQTPATCLGTGKMNQKCDRTETAEYSACTAINTRTINAIGHSFDDVVEAVAATCVAKGSDAYKKCTACNKYFAENATVLANDGKDNTNSFATDINSENHFWSETKTEETITSKTHYKVCERGCGAKVAADHVFAYKNVEVYPTCVQEGRSYKFCSVCQTKYYEDMEKVACVDANNDNHCDVCDKVIKEPTVDPTPDVPDEDIPDEGGTAPSCKCNCHKNGIIGLLYDFILFFQRLLGLNKTCDCGKAHY